MSRSRFARAGAFMRMNRRVLLALGALPIATPPSLLAAEITLTSPLDYQVVQRRRMGKGSVKGQLRERGGQGGHFSGEGLRAHAAKWAEKVLPGLERTALPGGMKN